MVAMQRLENLFIELIEAGEKSEEMFTCRSRQGIFCPAVTMWLMICKWIQGERSLSAALDCLTNGVADEVLKRNVRRKPNKSDFSLNTGGISRAQSRLKLEVLQGFLKRLEEYLIKDNLTLLWNGKRVFLIDGTTIALTRNEEVISKYKSMRNQNGEAYTPHMRSLICHELFSGVALLPCFAPYRGPEAESEPELAYKMIPQLPENSMLVADRAFGIFPVAYEAYRMGNEVLVRLTSTRAGALVGKQVLNQKNCDQPVEWKFRSTSAEHLQIPADSTVPGRFIKATIVRKGYRPLELFFFTTSKASAEELVALYAQRERIENDIRSLKHTLGMERLFSKTPAMIEKEFLLGVAAYNLIRTIIAQAAAELGLSPRKFSFSRAASLIRIFGNKVRSATSIQEQERLRVLFINKMRQIKLPNRKKQRIEPRKVAYPKSNYQAMRQSRAIEREKQLKILEKFGHRNIITTLSKKY